MRSYLFPIFLLFVFILPNHAYSASPVLGSACSQVGQTLMNDKGTDIMACLNSAKGPVWTVSSSTDLVTAVNNLTTMVAALKDATQASQSAKNVECYNVNNGAPICVNTLTGKVAIRPNGTNEWITNATSGWTSFLQ